MAGQLLLERAALHVLFAYIRVLAPYVAGALPCQLTDVQHLNS